MGADGQGTNCVVVGLQLSVPLQPTGRGEGLEVHSVARAHEFIQAACVMELPSNPKGPGGELPGWGAYGDVGSAVPWEGVGALSPFPITARGSLPSGCSSAVAFYNEPEPVSRIPHGVL